MARAVIMPKFGFTQEVATIVRWIVKEGETVEQGDPLVEVTTDKVNMEVEAPAAGTIAGFRFPEGAEVPVTEVIAYLLAPGEILEQAGASPLPAPQPAVPAAQPQTPETAGIAPLQAAALPVTPVARRMAELEGVDLAGLRGSGPGGKVTRKDVATYLEGQVPRDEKAAGASTGGAAGKVRATPAARRIAHERGIDLRAVQGTGFEGRVQGADVAASSAPAEHSVPPAPAIPTAGSAPVQPAFPQEAGQPLVIPLEGMRRTIAQRMQASAQQAPHIYLSMDIEMGRAERMRAAINARLPSSQPQISMTAVLLKAAAAALEQHPQLNSYLQGDQILRMPEINLGMAVALEEGLIVPVVRRANEKGLAQVAVEVGDLSRRARDGRLRPEDVLDGTFTLSNLGMFGIDHFTAIINPPQVAILAAGRIARRFVPGENDQPVARSLITVTLSCDHRAVDGALGARFLISLKSILETAGAQWG